MSEAGEWIKNHVYVPIIVGVVLTIGLGFLIYLLCRKKRYYARDYVYKRLEHEAQLAEQMTLEREARQSIIRDSVYMNCQYYLRSHPNYKTVKQLNELGSRIDKHWFLVEDMRANQELMLSCMSCSPTMTIPFTKATCKTIKDLFSLLQHPHIFPVHDFDFAVDQNLVFLVQPVSTRGSLKDLIYQSRYSENWFNKYQRKHKGLSLSYTQLYGKQILSGMLYLEEKGFPPHGHVQSGNVMIDDGICKLTGYENCFLGVTSRCYNLVKKKLKDENKNAVDTLCFGHLLYEMVFGRELQTSHPEPQDLVGQSNPQFVEILNFIFATEGGKYPTIKEIDLHFFFSHVRLPEIEKYNPIKIHLNEPMMMLLKSVKKGKPYKSAKVGSIRRKKSKIRVTSSSPPLSQHLQQFPITSSSSDVTTVAAHRAPPPAPSVGVPPPPPPPPAIGPIPPPPPPPTTSSSSERTALLGDIRKGAKLKKTLTNDRSAPKV